MLLTNYLILPLVNNAVWLYFIFWKEIDLKTETVESYIIFFNIVCFMRIVEFFTIVRRTVLLDARTFLRLRAEKEKTVEEFRELLLEGSATTNEAMSLKNVQRQMMQELDQSYLTRDRGYG